MKAWMLALGFGAGLLPMTAAGGTAIEPRDCQTGVAHRGACIAPSVQPPAPRVTAARRATPQRARPDAARRRYGKPIPDAELIGSSGAL